VSLELHGNGRAGSWVALNGREGDAPLPTHTHALHPPRRPRVSSLFFSLLLLLILELVSSVEENEELKGGDGAGSSAADEPSGLGRGDGRRRDLDFLPQEGAGHLRLRDRRHRRVPLARLGVLRPGPLAVVHAHARSENSAAADRAPGSSRFHLCPLRVLVMSLTYGFGLYKWWMVISS
ncbi:unnamed protein product, partial [Musa hybrid cultivar]